MTQMLIKMLCLSTDVANIHSCSSRREEMKLGHEDDVMSQEYLSCDCSYGYLFYCVYFRLAVAVVIEA